MKVINKKGKINKTNNSPPLKIQLKSVDNNSEFAENIINTVREPLVVLDHELKVVTASSSFYEVFKVSPEKTLGMLIYDLGNGQWNIPKLKELLESILPEKASFDNYEVEHDFSTIGKRIMLLNARQIKTVFGKEKIILLAIEDITDRKKIEAGLEKTRKELVIIKKLADEVSEFAESAINTVREPLIALDRDLRVVNASRSFYELFKVKPDKTIGTLIYDLGNHQWNIPRLRELLETILPEKASFDNYEVEHDFSTIGKRVMLLNARQIKRAFGKEKIILLAIEDITERRMAEKMLSEKNRLTSEYLNILLDHAHAPIIIWDSSMLIQRFNLEFEKLSGYNYTEVIDKNIGILFPKNKIVSTMKLIKNNLSLDNQEVIEIDILTKNKSIKTLLWNSANIFDEKGANKVATIAQDITERKRTEQALSRSEIRYRRLFESAKDGIFILDAKTGEIIDVNPFVVELFGYSKEIFLQKKIWEIGFFKDIAANKDKFRKLQLKEYVRFDNLILESSTGQKINVEFISNSYSANSHKIIQCNIRDITERIQTRKRHTLTSTVLSILNRQNEWTKMVKHILEEIKKFTDFEAVGIRLKEGEDYPYFETIGFPADFVKSENSLCSEDLNGKIICNFNGKPYLECMCGNVISGHTDPKYPFFTNGGSFWTNSTTKLLASTSEKDRQNHTRNRCNAAGYESVALILLHSGDEKIGLLQLNDKRKNKLTIELVQNLEEIGSTIGIAFKRMTIEKQIKESEEKFRRMSEQINEVVFLINLSGTIKFISKASIKILGYTPDEVTGKSISEYIPEYDLPKAMKAIGEVILNNAEIRNLILHIKKKDGSLISSEINSSAMKKDGIITGALGVLRDISERIKSEEEILILAHSLRSINECVSITDLDDVIIFVNESFIKTYGYNEEELIGKNISMVRSSKNLSSIVNTILPTTIRKDWNGELWNRRKDGSEFQVYLSTTSVKDNTGKIIGLIGVATDITDRKKLEASLSTAADIAKLGYWEYDVASGDFTFNDQYYRLIHGSSTAKQGGNLMNAEVFAKKLVHPDDAFIVGKKLREAIESPDPDYFGKIEARVLRENGDITDVSVQFMIQKNSMGKTYKVYGINQDITDRKIKEKELIEAKDKAEEMNRLKTSFLTNMSHELRTPLIGILGFAEFLELELKDKDLIEMANTIRTSGQRLNSTINNILDISEIESKNVKLNIKEQDLIKYLGEQIKSFTTPADEKGLTLNFEPKEVKLNAFIDPGMFESIINNLLHNAVKFTQKGKVTLRAMKQENFAVIEVEDTGIGVPKDLQEIIFDPFRQASEGHSRSFEGTGLGLTIVKKYMSLMNGTITLSSKKEDLVAGIAGGSTFVLKLPLTEHIVENVIRTHWV